LMMKKEGVVGGKVLLLIDLRSHSAASVCHLGKVRTRYYLRFCHDR
jgi:hypothetical protein